MPTQADAATLNVQPRQRQAVYEALAALPTGQSLKDLAEHVEMPERELRDALRKLDAVGLARRMKGTWSAVPLETAEVREHAGSATATATATATGHGHETPAAGLGGRERASR